MLAPYTSCLNAGSTCQDPAILRGLVILTFSFEGSANPTNLKYEQSKGWLGVTSGYSRSDIRIKGRRNLHPTQVAWQSTENRCRLQPTLHTSRMSEARHGYCVQASFLRRSLHAPAQPTATQHAECRQRRPLLLHAPKTAAWTSKSHRR